ncbi:hypothetical protein [Rhizobium laguerreae]|uniref:hypothetical protein n=1 Tax=Rhizobium laguerreae TaxID=1076926 RepID=UPI001C904A01|nr:hypothetical protein [Rhizobium laguerreae]MBY3321223.1 hypothetical protein [Rhizobium laguerreae]
MTTPSEVYTLTTGVFPDRYQNGTQLEGPVYGAQLMFTGPDAAIEVIGNKITQYMFGSPSCNPWFAELIANYKKAIIRTAGDLRKAPDDRVVLTGVWYHLDYNERPRFEPYVIHVISADGVVSSRRYKIEMFDYDSPGEGFLGMLALETTSPEEISQFLKKEAARIMGRYTSHEPCGLRPLQGVIWFPAEDNNEDDIPIIVSKLFTVRASDEQPDNDVEVFPSEAANPLRDDFSEALSEAGEKAEITQRLVSAYDAIVKEPVSESDKEWILRKLSRSRFGVYRGELVVREPRSGPITLSELANSSTARGSWVQVRTDHDAYDPIFSAFDDDDRSGRNDFRAMLHDRKFPPASEDEPNCLLESDWYRAEGSTAALRYMAVGPEPRLSW